jgi:hypothetical protein
MTDYSSNLSVPNKFVGAPQRVIGCVSDRFLNVIVCGECDPTSVILMLQAIILCLKLT